MEFLNNTEKVNVVFTFEKPLYNGDNLTEKEFLDYITKKIVTNANEAMAKEFVQNLEKAKYDDWPKEFAETINEWSSEYKNAPTFVVDDTTALYTMKVNTTWMYFGYDAEIIDRPSKATMDIEFYKTTNPDEIIERTSISRAMGTYNKTHGDGETWPKPNLNRMRKAYDRAGYKFAKAIKRIVD
ncbi:hypothetical protein G5B37_13570 [Rasiella rasia]|uniref:Uncharacterized protein n=1 Tax=Rasiella rasia TaxID=2744027 RepID=A0A6G6GPP5_9FLAO|nr:hypothetical protein [Rasiella rasia]QIE60556.1 hypothetical protein G5B37_13570 [Rasiella rasia]